MKPRPAFADLAGRVAIYARVSTEMQVRDDGSLDNQVHRCKQHLVVRGAPATVVDSVRVYREEGYSGKDTDRPELQRLLRDVRIGRVGLVLFTEFSRVSRSVPDFFALTDFFRSRGAEFASLREQIDTSGPGGKFGLLMLIGLAEFERETTSIRTRLAMLDRAQRGLFNGGPIPLGYRPDEERSGHLVIVEPEATAVREAFRLYLEIGSLSKVADTLEERGYRRSVKTSRRGKTSGGGLIDQNSVAHILQNPIYKGFKEVNREHRDLSVEENAALPESHQYRLQPAVWEPLVEADLFDRVQDMLTENYARRRNTIAKVDYDYVLRGLVRCSVCGTTLEPGSSKYQKYHTYRHSPGTRTPECGRASHHAEIIERAVLDRLSLLSNNERLLSTIVERTNDRILAAAPEREGELVAARARLTAIREAHTNMVANLMTAPPGSVPASFWGKAAELEKAIEPAEIEVSRLRVEIDDLRASRLKAEDYRAALLQFRNIYDRLDPLQKNNLLAFVLDTVEVNETHITVALMGRAPEVTEMEAFSGSRSGYSATQKWLPLCDSNTRPTD